MAEFAALPLFTDAYLADTRHLTTEEHGAYLLLLMEAWRRPNCDLPDNDQLLSRLTGLSMDRWAEVKPVIMEFWKRDNRSATFKQKRLSAERMYVAGKTRVAKEAAAKRWNKTKKCDADALQPLCQTDAPTPTPTPTPTVKEKKEEQDASAKTANSEQVETGENPDSWNPDRLLSEVMAAVGLKSGRIPTHWMPPASATHVWRWVVDLSLTPESIVDAARESRKLHSEPPNGPKALDGPMRRLAAALNAPALTPDLPQQFSPIGTRQNERAAFDRAFLAAADGVSAGTVHIDNSSRNPFGAKGTYQSRIPFKSSEP